jgi:glutathione S-transferase
MPQKMAMTSTAMPHSSLFHCLILLLLVLSCNSLPSEQCNAISPPKIKLTYFNIEGAAEYVRLALTLSKVDFEDDRLDGPKWGELKPKTPYGQVPVMTVDGGPMRGQSKAMLRWAGSTLSETLYPKEKLFDIEETIGVLEDLSRAWTPSLYIGAKAQMF